MTMTSMPLSPFAGDDVWFKQLFEASLDSTWLIHDDRFVECNAAAVKTLGYESREELLNTHPSKLSPRSQPDGECSYSKAKRMLAIAKSQGQHRFEWMHTKADGADFFAEVTLSAINLVDRQVIYCVWRDITERKQTEEALRASAEQFSGLVEQSIAGIYIIQDEKLSYVNPRYAEIFGYQSADELIGCDPLSLVAESDRAISSERLHQRLEGKAARTSFTFAGLRKDGSLIDVGVQGARATYRGRPAIIGLIQNITDKKQTEERIQRYVARLETAFRSTVEVATTLSAMRDPYTAGHERGVGALCADIGAEMGFDADRQEGLRVAGHLHDIGKMTIPADILSKPGKLNAIEYELVKAHAQAGYDVLKTVEWSWPVAQMVLQHHERMDGGGYPSGLAGDEILPEARILAVADVVEAMSSHRPYRPGSGIDKVLAEIERGRGTAYDPAVVDACIRLFRERGYAMPV